MRADSMDSVKQDGLDESYSVANIQTRSQQAYNIVFREASLLRSLLQSLYGNKDGYPVFGFQDCQSSLLLICAAQKRQPGYEGCSPSLEPKIQQAQTQRARKFLNDGANDGGVARKSTSNEIVNGTRVTRNLRASIPRKCYGTDCRI